MRAPLEFLLVVTKKLTNKLALLALLLFVLLTFERDHHHYRAGRRGHHHYQQLQLRRPPPPIGNQVDAISLPAFLSDADDDDDDEQQQQNVIYTAEEEVQQRRRQRQQQQNKWFQDNEQQASNLLIDSRGNDDGGDEENNEDRTWRQRWSAHEDDYTNASYSGALCHSRELLEQYCALSNQQASTSTSSGSGERICASDGRFYVSACELARASCLQHLSLCRMPDESYCLISERKRKKTIEQQRWQWCSREAYQHFKVALWREFNSSALALFDYLDKNRDGRLGARELWPLNSKDSERGGVDEAKVTRRRRRTTTTTTTTSFCDRKSNQDDADEFAFERRFDWSPCALGHMLVYEQQDRPAQLTRNEFTRAFAWSIGEDAASPLAASLRQQEQSPDQVSTSTSEVTLQMGESRLIDCFSAEDEEEEEEVESPEACSWSRYGVDLRGVIRSDSHLAIVEGRQQSTGRSQPVLHLIDAQLYLSGLYKCTCFVERDSSSQPTQRVASRVYQVKVQVLAQPRVSVRPKFQWSLPSSRIAFECHHDHIDTSMTRETSDAGSGGGGDQRRAARIRWLQNDQPIEFGRDEAEHNRSSSAACSSRASLGGLASGLRQQLVLERVQPEDSGKYTCQVELDGAPAGAPSVRSRGEDSGRLLIQDQPNMIETNQEFVGEEQDGEEEEEQDAQEQEQVRTSSTSYLWSFHESGISVFKLKSDDGQELELAHELGGQSQISGQVDGNWNQLTLCGGLTPDQVVICEWSDNAILVDVPQSTSTTGTLRTSPFAQPSAVSNEHDDRDGDELRAPARARPGRVARDKARAAHRKYIYVGQPNLNRVLVLDARAFELVAIVNTEPQPRRLFAFRPNKIHLSKWVRRRLGPLASMRWLRAIEFQQQQQQQLRAKHLQSQAHPLKLTPKSSRLYSDRERAATPWAAAAAAAATLSVRNEQSNEDDGDRDGDGDDQDQASAMDNVRRLRRHLEPRGSPRRLLLPSLLDHWQHSSGLDLLRAPQEQTNDRRREETGQRSLPALSAPTKLVQYDIWLLCYGKPLVVDAQSDLSDLPPPPQWQETGAAQKKHQHQPRVELKDDLRVLNKPAASLNNQTSGRPLDFTPRDSSQWTRRFNGSPKAESLAAAAAAALSGNAREARLRNRKSVQIIQSTFLPGRLVRAAAADGALHQHHHAMMPPALGGNQQIGDDDGDDDRGDVNRSPQQQQPQQSSSSSSGSSSSAALAEFKRLSVLTTHYVIAPRKLSGLAGGSRNEPEHQQRHDSSSSVLRAPPLPAVQQALSSSAEAHGGDLIQDLSVPQMPYSQMANPKFKLHHAYASHYGERALYRIAMDTYRYDQQIDLQQCDPLAMLSAVQGLVIIQCRASITHELTGQLILDELTSAKIQFNAQIKAQEAYLTPDSRYLITIFANKSSATNNNNNNNNDQQQQVNTDSSNDNQQQQLPISQPPISSSSTSVIYVQSVRVGGLKFMYEIKTSLEISQCSFVWRDGYYAAIFVALNRRDQQSELLSLRLADGRLELIVRMPGLAWNPTARHREPLNVNQELQIASLSTNEGLYLVDLEENRVIQGQHSHRHQASLPTLLWV